MNSIDQITTVTDSGSAQQPAEVQNKSMRPTEIVVALKVISENAERTGTACRMIMAGVGHRKDVAEILQLAKSTVHRAQMLLDAEGQ